MVDEIRCPTYSTVVVGRTNAVGREESVAITVDERRTVTTVGVTECDDVFVTRTLTTVPDGVSDARTVATVGVAEARGVHDARPVATVGVAEARDVHDARTVTTVGVADASGVSDARTVITVGVANDALLVGELVEVMQSTTNDVNVTTTPTVPPAGPGFTASAELLTSTSKVFVPTAKPLVSEN